MQLLPPGARAKGTTPEVGEGTSMKVRATPVHTCRPHLPSTPTVHTLGPAVHTFCRGVHTFSRAAYTHPVHGVWTLVHSRAERAHGLSAATPSRQHQSSTLSHQSSTFAAVSDGCPGTDAMALVHLSGRAQQQLSSRRAASRGLSERQRCSRSASRPRTACI